MLVNFQNFDATYKPRVVSDFLFEKDADRDFLNNIVTGTLPFPSSNKYGLIFKDMSASANPHLPLRCLT